MLIDENSSSGIGSVSGSVLVNKKSCKQVRIHRIYRELRVTRAVHISFEIELWDFVTFH